MENKRGQVAIFVIVAVIIIALVLLFYFVIRPNVSYLRATEDPKKYIESCIKEDAKNALELLEKQGGSLEPENYILYDDNRVDYLCYINAYYKPCLNQKPFLKKSIEDELEKYLKPKLQQCIDAYKLQLEKKGYFVKAGKLDITLEIIPTGVSFEINQPLTIVKEASTAYEKFSYEIDSSIYDLIMLSSSIINWEARYGDSSNQAYMLYYPNFKVEKYKQGDGSTVYVVTDRLINEKFVFASRSMVWPAGYGGVVQ